MLTNPNITDLEMLTKVDILKRENLIKPDI